MDRADLSCTQWCMHWLKGSPFRSQTIPEMYLRCHPLPSQWQSNCSTFLWKWQVVFHVLQEHLPSVCFKILNKNIANEFKMSHNPCLISWNSTMSIQDILNQLKLVYGCPSRHELLHYDTLFCLPFCATEAPKCLFWRIKQCQEIQVIADNPYTPMQLMTNAIWLLMAWGIFPIREFEDWETMPNKMYTSLKLFVHGAYAHQLVAIQLRTTRQQGYVANQHHHNMYNLLENRASVTDNNWILCHDYPAADCCQCHNRQHTG